MNWARDTYENFLKITKNEAVAVALAGWTALQVILYLLDDDEIRRLRTNEHIRQCLDDVIELLKIEYEILNLKDSPKIIKKIGGNNGKEDKIS